MQYTYTVRDRQGKRISGKAEAESAELLANNLQDQGWIILSLQRGNEATPVKKAGNGEGLGALAQLFGQKDKKKKKVKLATLVPFTTQLGFMIEAGLPLLRVLEGLTREMEDKQFQAMIEEVRQKIKEGSTFADALAAQPAFSRLYVNLVRAGEESGKLGPILGHLALYLEKVANLKRKIKSVIAYPLAITIFAVLVVFFMILKIVPIFQTTYARFHAKLPLPTQMLVAASDALRNHFLLLALLVIGIATAVSLILKSDRGRYQADRLLLRLPLFGPSIKKAILARTCRTLAILIESGIPLLETLRLVSQTSGNRVIERSILNSVETIRNGSSIGESFKAEGVFPETLIQLIYSGEESGEMEKMLNKGADFYEQQVEATTATLTSILEPLLIIFVGGMVGAILVCLFLPIFNLGKAIRGGGGM
ncbi:MAG: type II secretion system F family protein [Candidatus Tectomicrobia bacterium]|uniref:General secretion pathway protein F n=1 Tax=Tectimicrobiota bacterium TaxID=2528274 RepID=A0A932FW46_UNCTE|nr:type II secretion system F family protein [Candidatus Tectomicrobia bacterium]